MQPRVGTNRGNVEGVVLELHKKGAFSMGASYQAEDWIKQNAFGKVDFFWTPDPSVDHNTGHKIGHWTIRFYDIIDAIMFKIEITFGDLSEYDQLKKEFYLP